MLTWSTQYLHCNYGVVESSDVHMRYQSTQTISHFAIFSKANKGIFKFVQE